MNFIGNKVKKGLSRYVISAQPLFCAKKYSRSSKSPAVGVKYKYAKTYIFTKELYFE